MPTLKKAKCRLNRSHLYQAGVAGAMAGSAVAARPEVFTGQQTAIVTGLALAAGAERWLASRETIPRQSRLRRLGRSACTAGTQGWLGLGTMVISRASELTPPDKALPILVGIVIVIEASGLGAYMETEPHKMLSAELYARKQLDEAAAQPPYLRLVSPPEAS